MKWLLKLLVNKSFWGILLYKEIKGMLFKSTRLYDNYFSPEFTVKKKKGP